MKYNCKINLYLSIFFTIAGFCFVSNFQSSAAQNNPLSLGQILVALSSKKLNKTQSNNFLIVEVKKRGVGFRLSPEIIEELRNSGATIELIEIIRQNSPSTTTFTPTPRPTLIPTDTPTANPKIERYPTIEGPDEVKEKQDFSVLVSLTKELVNQHTQIQQGNKTSSGALSLDLPDKESFEIDVILTSEEFQISQNTSKITMLKGDDSTPASFRLNSKEISEIKQKGKVHASFFYEGRFLAKVSRLITIFKTVQVSRAETPSISPPAQSIVIPNALDAKESPAGNISLPKPNASSNNQISFSNTVSPDLTITIRENRGNSEKSELVVSSKYLSPTTNIYYFDSPQELYNVLQSQYSSFSSMSFRGSEKIYLNGSSNKTGKEALKGFGKQIWEKHIPLEIKNAFWKLKDKLGTEFDSIQIITNNPEFPWELAIPFREKEGKIEELNFLGTEFMIGRLHDSGRQIFALEQQLQVKNRMIIAPNYESRLKLPAQIQEKEQLTKQGFQILNGDIAGLKTLLSSLPQGIIHFAGHGEVKMDENRVPQYAIVLEDGKLDLNAWRGMIGKDRTNRSFFFFNACEVGQSQQVANVVDGWAPAVLDTGAIGYIGGLWALGDISAKEFSLVFYQILEKAIKEGKDPLAADILRQTRKHFLNDQKNNDPTFLAYIFYGDVNLRFY